MLYDTPSADGMDILLFLDHFLFTDVCRLHKSAAATMASSSSTGTTTAAAAAAPVPVPVPVAVRDAAVSEAASCPTTILSRSMRRRFRRKSTRGVSWPWLLCATRTVTAPSPSVTRSVPFSASCSRSCWQRPFGVPTLRPVHGPSSRQHWQRTSSHRQRRDQYPLSTLWPARLGPRLQRRLGPTPRTHSSSHGPSWPGTARLSASLAAMVAG